MELPPPRANSWQMLWHIYNLLSAIQGQHSWWHLQSGRSYKNTKTMKNIKKKYEIYKDTTGDDIYKQDTTQVLERI